MTCNQTSDGDLNNSANSKWKLIVEAVRRNSTVSSILINNAL